MSSDESKESKRRPGLKSEAESTDLGRRKVLARLGATAVGAAFAVPVVMSARSLVPNALYEKPRRFKAGPPEQFTQGPTFVADQRVFIFREGQAFYCMGASCTHLGCTVQMVQQGGGRAQALEFHCPCHGSKFRADGTNYAGPAPRPLEFFRMDVAPDDGQLVVDLSAPAQKDWRLSL